MTQPVKTKVDPTTVKATEFKESKGPKTPITLNVEVPYTDYQIENGNPYIADHYELGDHWDGAFSDEVGTIEVYIEGKIRTGEWANDKRAVKRELAKM